MQLRVTPGFLTGVRLRLAGACVAVAALAHACARQRGKQRLAVAHGWGRANQRLSILLGARRKSMRLAGLTSSCSTNLSPALRLAPFFVFMKARLHTP